ncbi:MAG: hypothetical protein HYZ34_05365 [Ignavibacteriae bacterium]|nr:hypothetical protein [Ignavibacteriota bacterium]
MKINIKDGSEYFKGLLLLIRKDRIISDPEVFMMKRLGKILGFEEKFCLNAILEILENKYIIDSVPVFSSKELAIKFIKDGFSLALSDKKMHPVEEEWLRLTAHINAIDINKFLEHREISTKNKEIFRRMEFDDFVVCSS